MDEGELLDGEGYPTEYALKRIQEWDVLEHNKFVSLMDFVKSIWQYPEHISEENKVYTLVTNGWSGNEDIIDAMQQNMMLNILYWCSSERGGKHVYAPMSNYEEGEK